MLVTVLAAAFSVQHSVIHLGRQGKMVQVLGPPTHVGVRDETLGSWFLPSPAQPCPALPQLEQPVFNKEESPVVQPMQENYQ